MKLVLSVFSVLLLFGFHAESLGARDCAHLYVRGLKLPSPTPQFYVLGTTVRSEHFANDKIEDAKREHTILLNRVRKSISQTIGELDATTTGNYRTHIGKMKYDKIFAEGFLRTTAVIVVPNDENAEMNLESLAKPLRKLAADHPYNFKLREPQHGIETPDIISYADFSKASNNLAILEKNLAKKVSDWVNDNYGIRGKEARISGVKASLSRLSKYSLPKDILDKGVPIPLYIVFNAFIKGEHLRLPASHMTLREKGATLYYDSDF